MALENTLVPKNWRDRGGGFRQPQAAPVAPAAADTGMRPVGFRNTGAIREQGERTAALAAGAASVGEPTSFRGGAGAPEPIAVMRGTATTFSPGRLPGHQFAEPEMATPLGAQQAWNRGMRGEAVAAGDKRGFTTPEATLDTQYGGFRAPGQTTAEIAATKEGPGKTAEGVGKGQYFTAAADVTKAGLEKGEGKQHVDQFNKWLGESPYSTYDTTKHTVGFVPKDEGMARDKQAGENLALSHGFEVGKQHFVDRQEARKWLTTQPLPANFDANAYLSAVASDPAAWAELMKKANAPGAPPGPVAPGFTDQEKFSGGLSPFSVGP